MADTFSCSDSLNWHHENPPDVGTKPILISLLFEQCPSSDSAVHVQRVSFLRFDLPLKDFCTKAYIYSYRIDNLQLLNWVTCPQSDFIGKIVDVKATK